MMGQPTPTATSAQVQRLAVRQADGTFKICHQKLRISPQASGQLSIQNMGLQEESKGNLYSDGGTNIGLMGKHFRITFHTGRFVDMLGFANGLEKESVEICSGVTRKELRDGTRVLIGLHESGSLPENEHSLVSTGQARENGTYLDDHLHRHGGDQSIWAPAV